jgi:deazaflavin-dependent oxidoreductase (nitroreductase family)
MRNAASSAGPARVAVVTGAGRGIGRAVAVRLAADGFRVVASDIDHDAAVLTATACDGLPVQADVSCRTDVDALAQAAVAEYGRVDVWVNNAGVLPQGLLVEQQMELLEHTWRVNIGGVVHGYRAALQVMRPPGGGHVVNVASVCALKPLPGLAFYSATKAAVDALSMALRYEARSIGVHVSSVLPYLADTAAGTGLRPRMFRALSAEQVADAVACVIRRPRARYVVPRRLGLLLTAAAFLPQPLQDAADQWLHLHELALDIDRHARAAYQAETQGAATDCHGPEGQRLPQPQRVMPIPSHHTAAAHTRAAHPFTVRIGTSRLALRLLPRVLPAVDLLAHRLTGGRWLPSRHFLPTALLTTRGHRTGRPHTVPVCAYPFADGSWIVVASNFGQPHHPLWSTNLLHHPQGQLAWANRRQRVSARRLSGQQQQSVWPQILALLPAFDHYAARTSRPLRIFRLIPVTGER